MQVWSRVAERDSSVTDVEVRGLVAEAVRDLQSAGRRILVIVPDATRTAPVGPVFKALHAAVAGQAEAFDVMVALGTHPPMTEAGICARLEITEEERRTDYERVELLNHDWNNDDALTVIGTIPAAEIAALSGDRFAMDVEVRINRAVLGYDQIVIIGPVFPHEVVGFSGGNKYLFPGVSGPEVLNFFHWLGAVITNPMIIGSKWTPVRRVVDRAAALVPVEKLCFCLVVSGGRLAGIFAGTPEEAWDAASDLSARDHVVKVPKPFHTVLSQAPTMYDELWVGGKCMYKLEPVVADGGELIIYAPHINEVSTVHGETIRRIGYHCRDYFLKQWDAFKDESWGVLAHSTHVRGIGEYADGVERCRIRVTLATGIPEAVCREINLGYRDPATIRVGDFEGREDEGVLYVPKAGEMLYQLEDKPEWAEAG